MKRPVKKKTARLGSLSDSRKAPAAPKSSRRSKITRTNQPKHIESALAIAEERYRALVRRVETEMREHLQIWNASQDLLVVADLEGKYLSVNPAWQATLGWPETELLGKTSQWILHPEDWKATRQEIRRLAAGLKTLRFENRYRHKDGSYRWISWNAVPTEGRIYSVGRDITKLKEAEHKVREARNSLAETAQRTNLDALLSALAHELRQPLTAIVANANAAEHWLNRTPPNIDEARAALRDIAANGHRTSEVIQSIRGIFSRRDQAVTLLDVNEVIRETINLLRPELESTSVVVQFDLSSKVPLISAHRGQLQQVLINLVTNAAEAMRTVSDETRLLRICSKSSNWNGLEVIVEDSGTGIDQKNMGRIFDPFFTTKSNGMGMGLAICRLVIEAHGGTLSVSHAVPHGAAFRIILSEAP